MTQQFDVVVEKDSAGFFVAAVPALLRCHAQARSLDELMLHIPEALDARQAHVVKLRYFAGLSIAETAAALSLSAATIKREWALARLYLKRAMQT